MIAFSCQGRSRGLTSLIRTAPDFGRIVLFVFVVELEIAFDLFNSDTAATIIVSTFLLALVAGQMPNWSRRKQI